MLDCLVIVEHNKEEISTSSLRLCARLQRFSGWSKVKMSAVVFGACQQHYQKTLGEYGVEQLIKVEGAETYGQENWRKAILDIVGEQQIPLVILPGTSVGRELAPVLAAQLNAGVVSDCQELSYLEDSLGVVIEAYDGQYQWEAKLEGRYNVVLMSDLDPGAVEPLKRKKCTLISRAVPTAESSAVQILETYYLPAAELDIGEADVVVGIGRGVETREDLAMVLELAATLGASLAGSRPAVDAGYISFARQIGQTGRLIAPQIYIAIGISGAPQHITGVGETKIVALNMDPQAPILRLADLGVTGDLREVVPLLSRRIKEIKGMDGQEIEEERG